MKKQVWENTGGEEGAEWLLLTFPLLHACLLQDGSCSAGTRSALASEKQAASIPDRIDIKIRHLGQTMHARVPWSIRWVGRLGAGGAYL